MINNPVPWPHGARCAVAFTFDMDADSILHLAHHTSADTRVAALSMLRYGPEIAVPRLVDLYAQFGMRQTFFLPAWCMEQYPAAVETILKGGHEVAHHGYLHEHPNALDPDTHHPVEPVERFRALAGLLARRLPDREARIRELFVDPARRMDPERFLLGGAGWERDFDPPANLRVLGHVPSGDHNAFHSSVRAVINVDRDSMARFGFSPPTRIFEAAGAAACIITDAWEGIELFLEPDAEVLVAEGAEQVAEHVESLDPARARAIGEAAYRRITAQHTYAQRVLTVEAALDGGRRLA